VSRDDARRKSLERFRDEYVGYLSHDLKNPLSVIVLQGRFLAKRLAERGLGEEGRAAEVISQSAAVIDRLVRELLEMAYLEEDHVQLRRVPTDLGAFLKAVLERALSTPDRDKVKLVVRDAATAAIDPVRIERVVVNLVQNALKYAPLSLLEVRVEVRAAMAVISVVDGGPGLSKEEASFVFDKYRRAPSAGKRDGLGLGLYICQKIVEAHGGSIGVSSTPGRGSTFSFEVPLANAQDVLPAPAGPEQTAHALPTLFRGARVLIVDDEANAVTALAELLRDEGLVVTAATGGQEALGALTAQSPDAVVLDFEMPHMSGAVLLQRIRARFPRVPAVFMTGYLARHEGIGEACAAAGAAYLPKPVDVAELLQTLGRIVPPRAGAYP